MPRALRIFIGLFCFFECGLCFGDGKVFVANHDSSTIAEFDVVGDDLSDPNTYIVSSFGHGMIDLGIDKLAGTLFVSYEKSDSSGGNIISLVDAWDGTVYGHSTISSDMNITGLAFDAKRFLLYGTERNTNKLYVMDLKKSQILIDTIELDQNDYACGLAINENSDILYVSEYQYGATPSYEKVKAYDIHNNFALMLLVIN